MCCLWVTGEVYKALLYRSIWEKITRVIHRHLQPRQGLIWITGLAIDFFFTYNHPHNAQLVSQILLFLLFSWIDFLHTSLQYYIPALNFFHLFLPPPICLHFETYALCYMFLSSTAFYTRNWGNKVALCSLETSDHLKTHNNPGQHWCKNIQKY